MRKVFLVGVGLSLNLLGLARLGEAQFRDNQLSIGVSGTVRADDLRGPPVTLGEIATHLGDIHSFFLESDLRDATCPSCSFPAFTLPQSFDCLGDCTDGHWQVSNGTASVEMMPDPSDPRFQLVRLEQDTTQAPVNCNQEYNLFVSAANYVLAADPHYYTPPPILGTNSNPAVYFFQQIEEAFHLATCPEPLGLATTLVGIQLQSLHGPVFNYQIITYDSRGVQFDGGFWSYTSASGSPVYGVNDTLWHLPTRVIDRSIVKVQIGERLRELIAQNPFGLSTDPNQWFISSLYSGSSTNGNAKIRSLQGRFLLGG